jgi:4-hydroxybenzoate polyprenyltransferase
MSDVSPSAGVFGSLQQFLARHLPVVTRRAPDFWRLMRMHRPIGIYVLLWPTLWCLWMAARGLPELHLIVIFVLGTVCMRAAGCCINDYADRNFDGKVKRTLDRPIVTGKVSPREALYTCGVLVLAAFVLVLFTNPLTVLMSVGGLALALCYPFAKRHTHLAQVVLGAAFSWGGVMAFTAQANEMPPQAWLLYIANLLWTVMYDTEYAMVDRDDDLKIGVKSTAILFGDADRTVIGALQVLFLLAMFLSGQHFGLGLWFNLGLVFAAGMFVYQQFLIFNRERDKCFQAFLHNHKVGLVIFAATVLDYALR